MSLLPQSKKSAEEIAKLRESLGMVGQAPADALLAQGVPAPAVPESAPVTAEVPEIPSPAPVASIHPAVVHEPKPVRSLKRSERTPVLSSEESTMANTEVLRESDVGPRIVRSLRKSEQLPLAPVGPPRPDSKLPIHRHSEQEVQEIRRQEALAMQAASHWLNRKAHPALVIPGYLFAIAGGVSFYVYDWDRTITASCVLVALIVATVIFLKKPLSVHHAAFIAVMSLFVIVFGALHYFPQLRHGT